MPYSGITAEINVTEVCRTADCLFCFWKFSPLFGDENTSVFLGRVGPALRAFMEGGGKQVTVTGGETTEAPKKLLGTLRIIQNLRAEFPEVQPPMLYTNGTGFFKVVEFEGIRTTILEHLVRLGITEISLSAHHYALKGRRVLSGNQMGELDVDTVVRTLVRAGLNVKLNCTLVRGYVDGIPQIDAYIRWAYSLGVTAVYFRDLFLVEHRNELTTPGSQEVLAFTDDHRVDFDGIVGEARTDSRFEVASEACSWRHQGTGIDHNFQHLPTGVCVFFGSVSIAPAEIDETTFRLYMIDACGVVRTDYYCEDLCPETHAARLALLERQKQVA